MEKTREDKRLTTAPIRERPKYADLFRPNHLDLPVLRKPKEDHEFHKRPQTSKGSRGAIKPESQYYEEGEDDLLLTSIHDKIDHFKKISKDKNGVIQSGLTSFSQGETNIPLTERHVFEVFEADQRLQDQPKLLKVQTKKVLKHSWEDKSSVQNWIG